MISTHEKIVVGYDDGDQAKDALALGRQIADAHRRGARREHTMRELEQPHQRMDSRSACSGIPPTIASQSPSQTRRAATSSDSRSPSGSAPARPSSTRSRTPPRRE